VTAISIVGALTLLITYGVWLYDYIRSDVKPEVAHAEPQVSLTVALVLLALAGVGAAFVSDWFIKALTPAMKQVGIPKAFAGLVIVAIAGNAVENVVGVQLAMRNRADFAISVILNSALQVALGLTPVLVFASLFFTPHLTLVFPVLLALVLLISGILVALIVDDGESTWQEGTVLVGFYVVVAASFWWGT
jgi:Ca2+:H+ antiporter